MRHPVWPPILVLMLLHVSPVHPGQAERPVPVLLRDLQNQDVAVRRAAAKQLAARGAVSPDTIPVLLQAIRDPDPAVSQDSAQALGKSGPGAIPALARLLEDGNQNVRARSVVALGYLAQKEKTAWPVLVRAFRDASRDVQYLAAHALAGAGVAAVPLVRENLQDGDARVRSGAAEALGLMGPAANEFAPDLVAALKDVDQTVRSRAALALARVDPQRKEGGAALVQALSDTSWEIRLGAIDLYSGTAGAHEDTIFAIGQDNFLHRVSLESAAEWYKSKLKKGEWVRSVSYAFSDGKLEYELYIANEGDANCCPTAGKVRGTYKVVKEGTYDSQKKERSTRWKMLVDTARREPISDTK